MEGSPSRKELRPPGMAIVTLASVTVAASEHGSGGAARTAVPTSSIAMVAIRRIATHCSPLWQRVSLCVVAPGLPNGKTREFYWEFLGWETGIEPATFGATDRRSTS